MDDQDAVILATFTREPRATYGEVGRRIGLSGNAVKARVHRLASTGVLRGFHGTPAPALLGLAEGLLVFTSVEDIDEREDELLASLPDVPGVLAVDVGIDHSVLVWTLHADEGDLERVERAAISLLGKPPSHRFDAPPAEPDATLAPQDWRVARALLRDARASLKDLVRRSGLSFKTLKRRLEALLASGRVRVEPVISGTQSVGSVPFRLVAVLHPGADVAADALFPNAIATSHACDRLRVGELNRPTLRDAQDAHRALRAHPAVERAFLVVATRRRSVAWLDEVIERRVAQAARPAQAPVPLPRTRS